MGAPGGGRVGWRAVRCNSEEKGRGLEKGLEGPHPGLSIHVGLEQVFGEKGGDVARFAQILVQTTVLSKCQTSCDDCGGPSPGSLIGGPGELGNRLTGPPLSGVAACEVTGINLQIGLCGALGRPALTHFCGLDAARGPVACKHTAAVRMAF